MRGFWLIVLLKPGESLRQDAIAVEFDTSHVPVREAFRYLESRGLVVSVPRKGVKVAGLDEPSILEITRMRAALEMLAMRKAMGPICDSDMYLECLAVLETSAFTYFFRNSHLYMSRVSSGSRPHRLAHVPHREMRRGLQLSNSLPSRRLRAPFCG